jgi:hypothetical protein
MTSEEWPVLRLSTQTGGSVGKRCKTKTKYLIEGWFWISLMFHNQARMPEPDASDIDETCGQFGISRSKLE